MMKKILAVLAISAYSWAGFSQSIKSPETTGKLAIRFENIEKAGGMIRLALYSNGSDFMVEEKAVLYNFKIDKTGTTEVKIPDLPYGSYAFAVFHDENENSNLDKNLFGVPVESYAFSKKTLSKWRLPTFEEVKFDVRQPNQSLTVQLNKWKL